MGRGGRAGGAPAEGWPDKASFLTPGTNWTALGRAERSAHPMAPLRPHGPAHRQRCQARLQRADGKGRRGTQPTRRALLSGPEGEAVDAQGLGDRAPALSAPGLRQFELHGEEGCGTGEQASSPELGVRASSQRGRGRARREGPRATSSISGSLFLFSVRFLFAVFVGLSFFEALFCLTEEVFLIHFY